MLKKISLTVLLCAVMSLPLHAQEKHFFLKDTLDGNIDFSDYVINMHGFVPFPMLITEPALGNFGGALALVFINPKNDAKFPDITGLAGMYTANKSWAGGLFRQGTVPKWRSRYTTALAYGDIYLSFYRTLQRGGQQEYEFKLTPSFFMLDASRDLYQNKIFAGLRYQFAYTQVRYHSGDPILPDSIFDKTQFDKNLGTLGIYGEYDSRNTIFTPDRGLRFKATYSLGRSYLGSDFETNRLDGFLNLFLEPSSWWVCGLKAEGQMVSEGAPFYYLPFLIMRGLPLMKYQGQQTILFETEQRFDLNLRWSLVGFIGTGHTYSDSKFLKNESWLVAGGGGFRYLVARLLKLRVGIDLAVGPDDQFAYYIVFGHYWNR